jgi:hypothetical protein
VEDSSEENHALALHTKKGGKFKRNFRQTFKGEKSSSNLGYQRRDVSEIQCFRCDNYGHYARNQEEGKTICFKRIKRRVRKSTSSKTKSMTTNQVNQLISIFIVECIF